MPARKKAQPIGKRILKTRKNKKFTLDHISNETGLSPKYISRIEKGEVIPPIGVILQISKALEIDSSILLKEEKKRVTKKSLEDYQKRTEDYAYQTLTPEAQNKHLKGFKVFIDPNTVHKGVSYQHAGEEFIYVLSGTVEVMVGDNQNVLNPGESFHFNSSIVHKLKNISDERAELLVVLYTP